MQSRSKRGGSCARPVEPHTSSLWMDLFSLDSVILIIVTCSCAIFIFEADFSETYVMTSAENSVSEPPDLKNFWGGNPQTPLQGSPPPYKKPSYGPVMGEKTGSC